MDLNSNKHTLDNNSDVDLHSAKIYTTPKKIRERLNELTNEERSRTYRKLFNHAWSQDGKFKNWLKEDMFDKTKCRSIAYNVTLICGKSELDKHAAGKKHLINIKAIGVHIL